MDSLTWSTLVKAGHIGVETGNAGAHVMRVGDPLWEEEEELQVAHRITLAMPCIHFILVAMVTVSSSRGTWGESTKMEMFPSPAQISVAASDGKLGGAWE